MQDSAPVSSRTSLAELSYSRGWWPPAAAILATLVLGALSAILHALVRQVIAPPIRRQTGANPTERSPA
jgi:hypothetical protein